MCLLLNSSSRMSENYNLLVQNQDAMWTCNFDAAGNTAKIRGMELTVVE